MPLQSIAKRVQVELLVVMEVAGVQYAPGDKPYMTAGAANRGVATGKARWLEEDVPSVPLVVERVEGAEPVEEVVNTRDEQAEQVGKSRLPFKRRKSKRRKR